MTRRARLMWFVVLALCLGFFACAIVGAVQIGMTLGRWAAGAL